MADHERRRRRKLRSLTPVGLTFPYSQSRLAEPDQFSWRENLIAKMWEEQNILDSSTLLFGPAFLVHLFHECTDECKADSDGKIIHKYALPSEDLIKASSAVIQWLGTNNGWCFVEKFVEEVKKHRAKEHQIRMKELGLSPAPTTP